MEALKGDGELGDEGWRGGCNNREDQAPDFGGWRAKYGTYHNDDQFLSVIM